MAFLIQKNPACPYPKLLYLFLTLTFITLFLFMINCVCEFPKLFWKYENLKAKKTKSFLFFFKKILKIFLSTIPMQSQDVRK